jgi:flagellar protein FlaG
MMNTINANFPPPFKTELGAPRPEKSATSNFSSAMVSQAKVAPPTDSELNKMIDTANKALGQIASSLEFSKDKSTGVPLIRVYDRDTKELIRQFPTDEMLSVSKAIDHFKGILIQQKA